jgi:carboxypeptidase D
LCGYDLNLTYPQIGGKFPTLTSAPPNANILSRQLTRSEMRPHIAQRYDALDRRDLSLVDHMERRALGLRSIAGRPNGTLDPHYQCDLFDELWDYAANFTYPWSEWDSES